VRAKLGTKSRRAGRRDSDSAGFTLIELMVVVLVIAVLLAIAIPTFLGARQRGQDTVAKSSLGIALAVASSAGFVGVDTAGMTTEESALAFLGPTVVSDGPKRLSVAVRDGSWIAAAKSDTGKCFVQSAAPDRAPTFGIWTGPCSAWLSSVVAVGSSWSDGGMGALSYPATVLATSGVAGYWRLGESAGAIAVDSGPNGLDGTYSGPVQLGSTSAVTSEIDPALSLDGSGGHVALPAMNLDLSAGITYMAWVRPTGLGFYERIIDLGNGEAVDNIWFGRIINRPDVAFEVRPTGSSLLTVDGPSGSMSPGVWQFLAVTEAPDGTVVIYRDGVAVGTQSYARFPTTVNRTQNYIGKSDWSNEPTFSGVLDEVAVFNRALTGAEIAAIYGAA
jgi:prepilin-type N-terminal cleavage/methylation domain-containing protein